MKTTLFFILLNFYFVVVTSGQNLVLNPSFEDTLCSDHPVAPMPVHAAHWYSPTAGTPDIYSSEAVEEGCGIQNIYTGYWPEFGEWQFPQEGNKMAGIYTYLDQFCLREFLQGKLTQSLQPGVKYCVSFWASLANRSLMAHDRLGAYLSADSVVNFNSSCIIGGPAQIQSVPGQVLADTTNWMYIEYDFIAQGGEQFIMIGNFISDDELTVINTGIDAQIPSAYYFIDNVKVELCDETSSISVHSESPVFFYPNPCNNQITIHPSGFNRAIIKNLEGKILRDVSLLTTPSSLDISELPEGYYLVALFQNQTLIKIEKLVKL